MVVKKGDPTGALVTVVKALDALTDDEKRWVLQSAVGRWTLGVALPTPAGGNPPPTAFMGGPAGQPTPADPQDPKTFMKTKDPKSDLQRIAALAYYLTHGKNTTTFKTRDLSTANTEAKGPKFHIPRAVANASRAKCGYLAAVGGGKKQLSAYGEEIVEALPNQDAVKALEAKRGKRRGGKRKTAKKKA